MTDRSDVVTQLVANLEESLAHAKKLAALINPPPKVKTRPMILVGSNTLCDYWRDLNPGQACIRITKDSDLNHLQGLTIASADDVVFLHNWELMFAIPERVEPYIHSRIRPTTPPADTRTP